MRPLRILHVTPYSADAWAYGGIPRLVGSLTRGLARRGHAVTVCTTDARDESARLPASVRGVRDGVDVRVFRNVSNRLAYHLQFFLPIGMHAYLAREARGFDVAHLHACRNVPGAIAAYHFAQAGIPYVLAPNGTAPIIERRRTAKRVFDAVAGRRVLHGAARLLAVSNAEDQQLIDLGVDPAVIRVIPNPIDRADEARARQAVRGRFRARRGLENDPIVLFLGRLSPRKRLDVLIRALAKLRSGARLVIAGNDMGAEAAARDLVRELALTPRVTFTGLLEDDERFDALADADVTVYPSEHEIFGLVPLESLLVGTPVVVTGDSGCGEVIRETGGGPIVPVGDADGLARAIDEVLADPKRWRAAAHEAATRARTLYGEASVCAQVEALYAEVVSTR